ncbi:MAG: D-tyrosyl-tRNA(Tyr) deacylase [Deltaproteobacteria bacterium GWA2_55_10]|nr:MAG: D-tyrosyl-tRNA(Tyr) deacylase [Deltaproteobacteria bacterium GWA2_55_10]
MRAVVQRVLSAEVRVDGKITGSIGRGLLVYVGVENFDVQPDLDYIASKVTGLRVFEDNDGKMNLNVREAGGALLLVSQFTLHGDCRKGRRPSFDKAEAPQRAGVLYNELVRTLRETIETAEGEFQAQMEVESINDGPITILLDSRKLF